MAGTEIVYKMFFNDDNGNACTVYIKKEGYAGAETEVEGGADPCVISMMTPGDGKFIHIKATECFLQFVSSTSLMYLDLFISPVKTYKVEVYRELALIWIGWVNPEYYSEPFLPAPYITNINCTDGLAELKNIPFPLPGETDTDYLQTLIYYIATCLQQIGLSDSMAIYLAYNLSATTTTDGAVTSRLFEYLYLDYRSMREEDGELWNCYDVLNEILSSFNLRIYQWGWNWWIDKIDHKHTTFNVEQYTGGGVYSLTTSGYDAVVGLTAHVGRGTDIRFINSPAVLEVQPAYKGYEILQDYGNRKNILKANAWEGGFYDDEWTDVYTLKYWTKTGTQFLVQQQSDSHSAKIGYSNDHTNQYILSDYCYVGDSIAGSLTDFWNAWHSGDIKWMFSFEAMALMGASLPTKTYTLKLTIGKTVTHSGGVTFTVIYDDVVEWNSIQRGEWVLIGATPVEVNLPLNEWTQHTFSSYNNYWTEFQTSCDEVRFYVKISVECSDFAATTLDDGVLLRNVRMWFEKTGKNDIAKPDYLFSHEYTIDVKNILEPETYDVKFANTPTPFGASGYALINNHVIYDSGGNAVQLFGNGQTHTLTLIQQVLDSDLNVTYRRPLFRLRGAIVDTTDALNFASILQDYNNRYYFPTGLSYDMKHAIWDGEWLQMWDEGQGEFNDDFSDDFWT